MLTSLNTLWSKSRKCITCQNVKFYLHIFSNFFSYFLFNIIISIYPLIFYFFSFKLCLSLFKIAAKLGVSNEQVSNVIIWGNHSSTQFPDVAHASVTIQGKTMSVPEAIKDDSYLNNEFIKVGSLRELCCGSNQLKA